MRIIYLKNFRNGFATNSSSTHSIIYKNKDDMFNDLNIFELDYYDRFDKTIAASKDAKIKYIAANIKQNSALFDVMSAYYPQMKEYAEEPEFGMTVRGYLGIGRNMEASVFFLKNLIENDEMIIVGGSDEEDFVYETCEGHRKESEPDNVDWERDVYKNGNYWLGFNMLSGGRLRFMTSPGDCVPEYPELVDLKITNRCQNNCQFCYAGSEPGGRHAGLLFVKNIISQLSTGYKTFHKRLTEFAIGGGNPLEHPNFDEIVEFIKEHGSIANVTINAGDIDRLIKNKKRIALFKKNISGVGVSVVNPGQICDVARLHKIFGHDCKITVHLIPEMLGADETVRIMNEIYKNEIYRVLLLGYKTIGRAANSPVGRLSDGDLEKISSTNAIVSIDTAFAGTYEKWLRENIGSFHYTVTMREGEFSMFVDAVGKKAYKSSYQLDKAYSLESDSYENRGKTWFYATEAFGEIRKDNGLPVYSEK